MWFDGGMGWFGANMAGRRNKNAFKFVLQLLILSQKQILGVANVVWGDLEVVWGVSRHLSGNTRVAKGREKF